MTLVGIIGKDITGPCKTIHQYLASIQRLFPMQVWSFDYYPILIRQKRFVVEYAAFFSALDAFSRKSKNTGVPMLSYIESMRSTTPRYSRPSATVPYISFAAFSSLAYGAQGLLYWTYWSRKPSDYEKYKGALVDLKGNKTKAWYAAQKVNRQIKALTPVFLGAEMVEVRHTGMIDMPGTYPFLNNFGPLETLSNDVKGVLVSTLRNNGHNYLVIVNHDVEKKQKVKMNFRKNLSVTRLTASDTGNLSSQNVKSSYSVTLTPGGYAVFEY